MPRFDLVIRLVVIGSILLSSFLAATVSASPGNRPVYQTEEPAATDTPTPQATDTPTPVPTNTATVLPTDTATVLPSDTPTSVNTETPTETATLIPTDTPTVTPEVTETATPFLASATPASPPPIVDFAAAPLSGSIPLTVTFVNSSTNATHFFWDFGDGLTQTETISTPILPPSALTLTHSYTQAGVYTVTLTATGSEGSQALTKTNYLTISEPALADFSAFPTTGSDPLTVQFLDNSSGASHYEWDFGDGSPLLTTDELTETLISPSHTYTQAGVYTVTLVVANAFLTI
jgi:PKD repeat protein